MADVFDVAAYILKKRLAKGNGSMTTWKLQKLVYYAQAWSTVWDDDVLFENPIEAWANGPVCPDLYEVHRGKFKIKSIPDGDPKALTAAQKDTVDVVIEFYGNHSAQYLSELTHNEKPWISARKGLKSGERGHREITPESMAEFYGGL